MWKLAFSKFYFLQMSKWQNFCVLQLLALAWTSNYCHLVVAKIDVVSSATFIYAFMRKAAPKFV